MTRSRKRKLRRTAAHWAGMPLATAAFACGGVAYAQQTETGTGLEEIIVTAQKRVEDVQKVPISIQVLGGEKLEQLQVSNFIDYAKYMPSMTFQTVGPGQSEVYFRGISSGYTILHAGYLPSVGTYLDETPVTTISGVLDVHMYDIQRVEGLAGPQGTLYGASSLAGTLRIITNKPDPTKFEAGYNLKGTAFTKGGDPGGSFEGFVNLPAGDHAAIRLVGYYDKEEGYIDNVPLSVLYNRPAGGLFDFTPTAERPWLWTIHYTPTDYTNETLNPHTATFNNAPIVEKNQNYVENSGGRAAIKLDLNDHWTVMPVVMHQEQKAHGDFEFDPKVGDLQVANMRPVFNNDRWTQSALTVTGKISNLDVVYSGSWFTRHVDNQYDYTNYSIAYDYCFHFCYTFLPEVGHSDNPNKYKLDLNPKLPGDPTQYVRNLDNYTKLSHELRISTPADYSTRLIAGAFFQRQTDAIRAEFREDGISSYWYVPRNPGILYLTDQDRVDRDSAVFADVTHDFSAKFKMSAGIREFAVNNTLYGFFGYNANLPSASGEHGCFAPAPANATRPCINTQSTVKEQGETHRVNFTYQFEPNRMVYATYSTGFRPGGNNRRPQAKTWAADTITNYEIGWKTAWRGNSVRFNGALFHEDWKGAQVSIQGENGITSQVNAGDAKTEGLETQLDWQAMANLTLSLSGTYVKAHTTTPFCKPTVLGAVVPGQNNCNVTGLDAAAGQQLPGTPKVKANATARYRFNMMGRESFAQLAGVYQGSTTFSLEAPHNQRVGDTPAFSSFDFSIGTGEGQWTLEAFVNNVTDERGELARTSQCGASYCYDHYRVVPTMPRNFGVKYGRHF